MTIISAVLLLAFLVESFTEYLFGQIEKVKPYLKYIALVVGVGAAVAYKIDILGTFGVVAPFPWIAWIVSGLIMGRGSNFVNDIISALRSAGGKTE